MAVLELCLCEALYLPALRATFLQRKARLVAASGRILIIVAGGDTAKV